MEAVNHPDNLKERFWKYVNKGSDDECWNWNGSLMKRGNYGQLRFKLQTLKAHRLSYELNKGLIPEGLYICHHCGNSKCVNPKHLYAGTPKQNWQDAIDQGKAYILKPINPEDVHSAKINFTIAEEIRNSQEKTKDICSKYNITKTMVSRIKRNLAWKI